MTVTIMSHEGDEHVTTDLVEERTCQQELKTPVLRTFVTVRSSDHVITPLSLVSGSEGIVSP